MLNRRQALLGAVAGLIATLTGVAKSPTEFRKVYKLIHRNHSPTEESKMEDLSIGDRFLLVETDGHVMGTFEAISEPRRIDGVWGINVKTD